MATDVGLEVGAKRVFAFALEWPGWCRAAKTEDLALEALRNYRSRYAPVAGHAGIAFPGTDAVLTVTERVPGNATTDFGAPAAVAAADGRNLDGPGGARLVALVTASWVTLDRVVAGAPAELRKGPRGGGRDRDAVVDHVLAAETAYARKLGVKQHQPDSNDDAAITALRDAIAVAISGGAVPAPGWPPPYAARRIAWHVLDHAWEIEDRSSAA